MYPRERNKISLKLSLSCSLLVYFPVLYSFITRYQHEVALQEGDLADLLYEKLGRYIYFEIWIWFNYQPVSFNFSLYIAILLRFCINFSKSILSLTIKKVCSAAAPKANFCIRNLNQDMTNSKHTFFCHFLYTYVLFIYNTIHYSYIRYCSYITIHSYVIIQVRY